MNVMAAANAFGARWAGWMLGMAWQVALLTGVLWLLSIVLRKAPASLRYVLWLLVFFKLVIDPALGTPWSAGTFLSRLPVDVVVRPEVASLTGTVAGEEDLVTAGVVEDAGIDFGRGRPIAKQMGTAAIAGAVWAGVAAFLILLLVAQSAMYTRRILPLCVPAPDNVQRVFRRLQAALGTFRGAVYVCGAITTPGVFGLFKPRILLPATWHDDFTEEELASVLAHELAHIKRSDILANWATTVLACLYWFHPAVWIASRYLRREREMACDDAALVATGREGRAYAGTILRVAEGFSERVPAGVGLLGLLEMSDNLLHRVRAAGDATRPRRAGWGSLAIVLLMAALLPMGTWRAYAAGGPPAAGGPAAAVSAPVAVEPAAVAAVVPAEVAAVVPAEVVAREAGAVAVLPVFGTGPSDEFGEAPAKLNDLLLERLLSHGVRLVDREKIEKVAGELALGASGLAQAETAVRLGQLVGARVLVSPKLMRLDGRWVLTARLIDAETSEVAAVKAEAGESDGLTVLAENAAAGIAARMAEFGGRPRAAAGDDARAAGAALRSELAGKRLPRVVVVVPESHIGTWVPDPAGENAIAGVLAQAGFEVVDVNTFLKKPESSWWMNIFHGPAEGREGTDIAIRQGWRSGSTLLHNARLEKIKGNADIFVVGEAFSEYAGEHLGFKSCRARIELKAIETATEKTVASESRHGTAADTAELIAGKAALRAAGTEIGIELARTLAAYWSNPQRQP